MDAIASILITFNRELDSSKKVRLKKSFEIFPSIFRNFPSKNPASKLRVKEFFFLKIRFLYITFYAHQKKLKNRKKMTTITPLTILPGQNVYPKNSGYKYKRLGYKIEIRVQKGN